MAMSVALLAACDNAGENLQLPPLPFGTIGVGVYFDADGSGTQTTGDQLFAGARVSLLAAGGIDTIRTAVSGVNGVAQFDSVPVGTYRVVIDRAALGDTVGVAVGDTGTIRITAAQGGSVGSRVVRLGYSEVTIGDARMLPPGRRVYVRGIVHTPMQVFRDSSSFISGSTGSIRITGARHRPGRTGNNAGDSVMVLATTGTRDGQPVLVDGLVGTLAALTAPTPQVISVATSRTADGGALDAAFVTVVGAIIVDTSAAGPDFLVQIRDPNDAAIVGHVMIDAKLAAPHTIFKPGQPITVRGALVPRGDGTWMIKPRGANDVTIG